MNCFEKLKFCFMSINERWEIDYLIYTQKRRVAEARAIEASPDSMYD